MDPVRLRCKDHLTEHCLRNLAAKQLEAPADGDSYCNPDQLDPTQLQYPIGTKVSPSATAYLSRERQDTQQK